MAHSRRSGCRIWRAWLQPAATFREMLVPTRALLTVQVSLACCRSSFPAGHGTCFSSQLPLWLRRIQADQPDGLKCDDGHEKLVTVTGQFLMSIDRSGPTLNGHLRCRLETAPSRDPVSCRPGTPPSSTAARLLATSRRSRWSARSEARTYDFELRCAPAAIELRGRSGWGRIEASSDFRVDPDEAAWGRTRRYSHLSFMLVQASSPVAT